MSPNPSWAPALGPGAVTPAALLDSWLGTVPRRRNRTTAHRLVGFTKLQAGMMFMRWAIEQREFPTIAAVQEEFQCCRATAYRWTQALAEVYGLDPASRHEGQYG